MTEREIHLLDFLYYQFEINWKLIDLPKNCQCDLSCPINILAKIKFEEESGRYNFYHWEQ